MCCAVEDGITEGTDTGWERDSCLRTLESASPETIPPPTSVTFICQIWVGAIAAFKLLAEGIQGYSFYLYV